MNIWILIDTNLSRHWVWLLELVRRLLIQQNGYITASQRARGAPNLVWVAGRQAQIVRTRADGDLTSSTSMARRKTSKHASLFSSLPQDIKLSILGSKSASKGKEKVCEHDQNSDEETARPPKKRKLNALLSKELERYDATGLVPHYINAKQVPGHLQKCE